MRLRSIYWGVAVLILAVAVYGASFFMAKLFLPSLPKPESQSPIQTVEPVPLPSSSLLEPFIEEEIKPASEIWQRWENLKKETDMPVE